MHERHEPTKQASSGSRSAANQPRSTAQRRAAKGTTVAAAAQLKQLAAVVQRSGESAAANRTGLPDALKAGVEHLSGQSLDHVRVHRNSAKPAELNAHAYAQGGDIHVAPGQEKHLPHEAWHVAQQAQGRVQPTLQAKGVAINDSPALEQEADVMGAKAANMPVAQAKAHSSKSGGNTPGGAAGTVQREIRGLEDQNIWGSEIGSATAGLSDLRLQRQINRLHGVEPKIKVRDMADLVQRIRSGSLDHYLGDLATHAAPPLVHHGMGSGSRGTRSETSSGGSPAPSDAGPVVPHVSSPLVRARLTGLWREHRAILQEGFSLTPQLLFASPTRAYIVRAFDQSTAALLAPMAVVDGADAILRRYAAEHLPEAMDIGPRAFAEAYLPQMFEDQFQAYSGHMINALGSWMVAYPMGGPLYRRLFTGGAERHFVERLLMRRALRLPVMALTFGVLEGATRLAHVERSRADALQLQARFPEQYAELRALNMETVAAGSMLRALLAVEAAKAKRRAAPPPGYVETAFNWMMGFLARAGIAHLPTAADARESAQQRIAQIPRPVPLQRPALGDIAAQFPAYSLTMGYARRMRGGASIVSHLFMGDYAMLQQVPAAFWQIYGTNPSRIVASLHTIGIPPDEMVRGLAVSAARDRVQTYTGMAANAGLAYGISYMLTSPVYRSLTRGAPRPAVERFLVRRGLRGPAAAGLFFVLEGLQRFGIIMEHLNAGRRLQQREPVIYRRLQDANLHHALASPVDRVLTARATRSSSSPGSPHSGASSGGGSSAPPLQITAPPPPPSSTMSAAELFAMLGP